MRIFVIVAGLFATLLASSAHSLSLAPEEFVASRQLACVLAEQSLGYLSENEYGSRTHTVLDGFDDLERDNILSKALGYMDGLMFAVESDNPDQVDARLQTFVDSSSCEEQAYYRVTVAL
ncbi:hypothetical protein EY643_18325 [Halioglobus maricola]|uniref:Uncharacterized protein n=1 Tax=Halioglobus maricola TaxID=2601894 RepID=A0A5P9NR75_9GAMM|nr:hypothetical protein [Halioglobus maricola]QFU77468.1 hypothetical protein EY643_18325 [Halioglobus maricola]